MTENYDELNSGNNDYEVGYGKPPKESQFKKGVTGNSKGRPKKATDITSIISSTLDETITVSEGNSTRELTVEEATNLALINKAMKGDLSAADEVMKKAKSYSLIEEPPIKKPKGEKGGFILLPDLGMEIEVWEKIACKHQEALIASSKLDIEESR